MQYAGSPVRCQCSQEQTFMKDTLLKLAFYLQQIHTQRDYCKITLLCMHAEGITFNGRRIINFPNGKSTPLIIKDHTCQLNTHYNSERRVQCSGWSGCKCRHNFLAFVECPSCAGIVLVILVFPRFTIDRLLVTMTTHCLQARGMLQQFAKL